MDTSIIVALITGGLSLISVYLTVRAGNQRIMSELDKHEAIQDERISELTREVRKHNSFAERIPVLESRITNVEHQLHN
jgi:hypothetical protein